MHTADFALLYDRELKKLIDELSQYKTDDEVWKKAPGISNSAGNLAQHLVGNLKTYIGMVLGGVAYTRERDKEFNARMYNKEQLIQLVEGTRLIVKQTFDSMPAGALSLQYSKDYINISETQPVSMVLTYLLAHASYHIGQVNYHRRILTN